MLTVNAMNKRQSFVWLWRNDPEAKWFWFRCFLTGKNLKGDVLINIQTFGIHTKQVV